MNILLSSTYTLPYVSGVTVYLDRMSKLLNTKGFTVRKLAFEKRSDYVFKVSKGFVPSLTWFIKATDLVKWSEITVANLPQFEAFFLLAIAKFFQRKTVCIFHCDVALPKGIFNRLVEQTTRIISWLCLLICDEIISYTKDYASSISILKMFANKTKYVLPPIVKPGSDSNLDRKLKNITKVSTTIIGFAGRLAEEKGIELILQALDKISLNNFMLLIAGNLDPVGEGSYKNKILSLVKKNNKRVIFTGEIPPEKMGSFYKNIDVLVLPSTNKTESFGMVQAEAMLWGVPVVASDLPGVRVPVQLTGMGKVFTPGNVSELAKNLEKVLKNPNDYKNQKMTLLLFGNNDIAISKIFEQR